MVTFASLEWTYAPMPGGNAAVSLAQLPDPGDHAFRAFVRFPAGWERPGTGHYAVAEEFVVLEGSLAINGHTWESGGYAWIPAYHARTESRSLAGCLAFAWFGGPPRWVPGATDACQGEAQIRFAHWLETPRRALRDGICIRELRCGPEHATWVADTGADAARVLPRDDHETLDLADFTWSAGRLPAAGLRAPGARLVRTSARPA